jgi:hypothetical protein
VPGLEGVVHKAEARGILHQPTIRAGAGDEEPVGIGLIALARQFAGTAVKLDDEGASAHDLFIVGFDVCAELTGSPRARLYNVRMDCNVGAWSHQQPGGFEIHDVTSKEFMFQLYKYNGERIR